MVTKENLFEAALALNGEDKKYQITVEGNKIITRVKWMDATFFSPEGVTDEMKEFEYIVEVNDKGKYKEITKSSSVSKSIGPGGASYKKSGFYGKEITFNKTVGLGKDNETGETGVISTTFYSEDYKNPVRNLLKESGYKKVMGKGAKIGIGIGIVAVAIIAILAIILVQVLNKKPVTPEQFTKAAEELGYYVVHDEQAEAAEEFNAAIAAISPDEAYQINFVECANEAYAKDLYAFAKGSVEEYVESQENKSSSYVSSSKYENYTATASGYYTYVARVGSTVFLVEADSSYKGEIEKLIKKINY